MSGLDLKSVNSKKLAIVTGVNGQDGSYLSEFLLDEGYDVIGIIRRSSTDNKERIEHLINNSSFELVEGDVTDSSNVNSWIREFRPDEFYNLAAQSHVGTSFSQPQLTWRVNAEGVLNVLEAIKNISPRVKLYQASTSEMFGRNYSMSGNTKVQDEHTPFAPQSPYGVAKVAAHQSVQMYREAYNIFGSCGILFNHESPRRGEQFVTRKITKWLGEYSRWYLDILETQATYGNKSISGSISLEHPEFISLHNKRFPKLRLGNLSAYRDWGHAKDYVRAMWMILQADKSDDYVVSTGSSYSVKDFLTHSFKAAGINDYSGYVVQDPIFVRPAEVDYLMGRSSKIREELGWAPEYSFSDLVKEMVKNDIKNG